jgi:hypothetical protein
MADRSSRASSLGVLLLAAGAAAIGIAYAATIGAGAPTGWVPWFVAFGCVSCSVGLFVVGAASRGPIRPLIGWVLLALFVVMAAAFGAALAMPAPEGATERIVLGLPQRLAILFYGIGFLPLIALPLTFAMTLGRDDKA